MAVRRDPVSVSVIIPTRDRRDLVVLAIESVFSQRGVSVEVIVVDDGSRDGTPEVLEERFGRRIRLLRRADPGGPAQARNDGLLAATGDAVAFLDSDDTYPEGSLASRLARLDGRTGAVYGRTCASGGGTKRVSPRAGRPPEGQVFRPLLSTLGIYLGSVLLERRVAESAGLFESSLRHEEDREWLLRVALKTEFGFVNAVLCHRLSHPESLRRNHASYLEQGTRAMDLLFARQDLPPWARDLHPFALAHAELRLARAAHQAGNMPLYREHYHQALRHHPQAGLSLRQLRRYIGSFLRS